MTTSVVARSQRVAMTCVVRMHRATHAVMPGLVPGIHVLLSLLRNEDVDGRVKPAITSAGSRRFPVYGIN
jgi:hypothetical protein